MDVFVLQLPSGGLLESAGQMAVVAGTIIIVLMLVGLGGYAYKQLRGDGIEWPEDKEMNEDGVRKGDSDDEWKYY